MEFAWSFIQDVPKLITQKSAVIHSEVEVTIFSGVFQTLYLVPKFSFKPPDGISPMQSCIEIFVPQSHSGCLDWTWWNDSMATPISCFNTPGLFYVGIL